MIDKPAIQSIFDYIFSKSKAHETQVTFHCELSYLTRFANSIIHQNVMEKNNILSIITTIGKKTGEATTNSLKKSDILNTLNKSIKIAECEKDNPDYCGLPPKTRHKNIHTYFRSTHYFSHKNRACIVRDIIQSSKPFKCFGTFTTGVTEIAIGNSKNLFSYNRGTDCTLRLTMRGKNGSSSGQCSNRDIKKLDFFRLRNDVHKKTRMAQNPQNIKTGKYSVVLTPEAASDILGFLGFFGFNSLLHSEGRSCLTGTVGKKMFSKKFTLLDDSFNERGFAFPFDFEGMPKKKLTLVEKGIVKNIVYDRMTAHKAGKRSTGHFVRYDTGPIPLHLVVKQGQSSFEEMICNTETGILITSFHYVNIVEPKSLTLTGMTRNGTFMIKHGKIAYPVKNLRFNQSILEALKNIIAISRETRLVESGNSYSARFPVGSILPFIAIKDFSFNGITKF